MIHINLLGKEKEEEEEVKKEKEEGKGKAAGEKKKHRLRNCALGLAAGASLLLNVAVEQYFNPASFPNAAYTALHSKPQKHYERILAADEKKDENEYFSLADSKSSFSLKGNKAGSSSFSLASFKPKPVKEMCLEAQAENADLIARILDYIALKKGECVMIVDKDTQTARIYKLGYVLVDQTDVSTGKNNGDKERSGDNKTPIGVFKVVSVENSEDWMHNNEFAYGHYFLRLGCGSWDSYGNHDPRGWSQIGVHGTSQPEKLGNPASEGCIRLENKVIAEYVANGYLRKGTRVAILGSEPSNDLDLSTTNLR